MTTDQKLEMNDSDVYDKIFYEKILSSWCSNMFLLDLIVYISSFFIFIQNPCKKEIFIIFSNLIFFAVCLISVFVFIGNSKRIEKIINGDSTKKTYLSVLDIIKNYSFLIGLFIIVADRLV